MKSEDSENGADRDDNKKMQRDTRKKIDKMKWMRKKSIVQTMQIVRCEWVSERGGEVYNNEACIEHCLLARSEENANYFSSIQNQSLIYL